MDSEIIILEDESHETDSDSDKDPVSKISQRKLPFVPKTSVNWYFQPYATEMFEAHDDDCRPCKIIKAFITSSEQKTTVSIYDKDERHMIRELLRNNVRGLRLTCNGTSGDGIKYFTFHSVSIEKHNQYDGPPNAQTKTSNLTPCKVHQFWEMVSYLANTVLFVLVGITISETAINGFEAEDVYYLFFLYVAVSMIRLLMLFLLSPILSRIRYGVSWQYLVVMMWGGLRGAVGICLALQVYKNKELCHQANVGPKFLIQTSGIVLLTLVVNGTTTKMLLDTLKVTEISVGKLQDMTNAVRQIVAARFRTLAVLKHDRFLADANWSIVEKDTTIRNPYQQEYNKKTIKSTKRQQTATLISKKLYEEQKVNEKPSQCENCDESISFEPSASEYKAMTEEARLRLLKAMKISCWRQFEKGVLSDAAVQILTSVIDATEDNLLAMIHVGDLRKYWRIRGFFPWLRRKIYKLLVLYSSEAEVPPPRQEWRQCFYKIAVSSWFDITFYIIVLLSLIPVIWENVYNVRKVQDRAVISAFLACSCVFATLYFVEFLVKTIGKGFCEYWRNPWNYIDAGVLLLALVEMTLSLLVFYSVKLNKEVSTHLNYFKVARLIRFSRAFRWLRPCFPVLIEYLDKRINDQWFLGYDVGKGFVTAIEDVMKYLPQMVDHARVLAKFKYVLENERLAAVKELGMLQKDHPDVTVGVKTRHASRSILNQMKDTLLEMKDDGLIDEKEFGILALEIEGSVKRLWHSPASIKPSSPSVYLRNISWTVGHDTIKSFVDDNATLVDHDAGEILVQIGQEEKEIILIASGMVKIHYEPTEEIIQAKETIGKIPNTELIMDLTFSSPADDYFSTGTVIGELSFLTDQKRAASVVCETPVQAYHIEQGDLERALDLFNDPYDSLESRMWRACGIRLAAEYLPTQSAFTAWTSEKIRSHLERSTVPIGTKYLSMSIPPFVSEVILIYGQVTNHHTKEVYTAPCLIPPNCTKLAPKEDNNLNPRLLVIANEEEGYLPSESYGSASSLHRCMVEGGHLEVHDHENTTAPPLPLRRMSLRGGALLKRRETIKEAFGKIFASTEEE